MLVYRDRIPAGDVNAVEAALAGNGWDAQWRNGVYPFRHYHSTPHPIHGAEGPLVHLWSERE